MSVFYYEARIAIKILYNNKRSINRFAKLGRGEITEKLEKLLVGR